VRGLRRYRLVFFLLIYGAFLYVLVPPIFDTHETGDPPALPEDASLAVVSRAVDRPTRALEDYRAIWEQNVFRTGKSESAAKESTVDEIPTANSNVGLRLVGTVVVENSGKSLAMIAHEDTGLQESYWEGSRLGSVLIKRILQDQVIIDLGGDEMILSTDPFRAIGKNRVMMAQDSPGTRNAFASAYPARLNREEVTTALPDYLSFVKAVKIRTVFEAGRPDGILIYKIDPDGLFGKIGLEDGDVIKAVNGESLAVSMDAVEIYNRLKHGGRTTLSVQRGEENGELQFDVT